MASESLQVDCGLMTRKGARASDIASPSPPTAELLQRRRTQRVAVLWLVLPLFASALGIRSCAARRRPAAEFRLDTVFDRPVVGPARGTAEFRRELGHALASLDADMLLPVSPFPLATTHDARVMVTKAKPDGTVVATYQLGGNTTSFLLTVSPTGKICTPQSVIRWEEPVPVRTATGCLARNPGAAGGVFIEWLERGRSVHVEATSTDADAVLAWLGAWQWLRG